MNTGLKALSIAAITVSCVIGIILKADPLTVLTIGFLGVWAIDELA